MSSIPQPESRGTRNERSFHVQLAARPSTPGRSKHPGMPGSSASTGTRSHRGEPCGDLLREDAALSQPPPREPPVGGWGLRKGRECIVLRS